MSEYPFPRRVRRHLGAFLWILQGFWEHLFYTPYLSVFSPNVGKCGKNADQNNSEYRHFLCSVLLLIPMLLLIPRMPLAQVFSCEFCEISVNTFFTEHLRWLLLSNKIRKIHCRFLFSRKSITNMNSKSKREEKHSSFNTKTFNDFVWELVMRNSNKTAFSTV